jgi:hypothetical protein
MMPKFLDVIPESLEPGKIYISIKYSTAIHLCPCGCNEQVVTPVRPTDWSITWNGEAVTLEPSIGNWSLECQSHYWIRENRVIWARKWSRKQVDTSRKLRKKAKARYPRKVDVTW